MDKQAQIEELCHILDDFVDGSWDIALALYAAGYRKVEKPPVLTDAKVQIVYESAAGGGTIWDDFKDIAQAQRDADWKAMRGEE